MPRMNPNSSSSSEELFCLKWSDYNSNLTNVFEQLLQEGSLVDVTISTDSGHSLQCHKLVLLASSGYFQKLFLSSPQGQGQTHFVIVLQSVSFRALRQIVEYMYRGSINVELRDLGNLLRSAKRLQIWGLVDLIKPLEASGSLKRRNIDRGGDKEIKKHNVHHEDDNEFDIKKEMLEITPGITEIDERENENEDEVENNKTNESDWTITNPKNLNDNSLNASENNPKSHQYQLKTLLQKYVDNSPDGKDGSPPTSGSGHVRHNSSASNNNREKGPSKSWSQDTMAQAIWSVLQKGFSLNHAARTHDIPYPTFTLYAHRVHNMLGPSSSSTSDSPDSGLRPKNRGRPQRVLKGNWPQSHVQSAIQTVVFRKGGLASNQILSENSISYPSFEDVPEDESIRRKHFTFEDVEKQQGLGGDL